MRQFVYVVVIMFVTGTARGQGADSSAFYFEKGKIEQEARRFREAEKHFAKASSFAPSNKDILKAHASSLLSQNRYAEARVILLKAEKTDPNDPEIIDHLTTLSFNLRKWDEAIAYAQKNKIKPVSYIIGRSHYETENYAQAITFLQQAMKEEPARADVPYILARAYLDMSNYKQSAAHFEKAIALDSSRAQWIYEASLVFYAIPDYKRSLEYMLLAGKKGYPRNNDYIENLGNAHINVKQYAPGIELLKEVLQRKPADQELLYQIAQANYDSKNYQEAIDYWDKVLGNDKSNARALYMIGMSYQKKGETQKGQQLCDRAIAMDPSLQSLKRQMSQEF